ncbi:PepSY domain-containing protein [Micromonospora sp. NPDC000089]|uniref:PepSY domain-containing protein n=1 Tax=unclassified Micromonospora TaxID=2617518 RepID=UPI00368D8679
MRRTSLIMGAAGGLAALALTGAALGAAAADRSADADRGAPRAVADTSPAAGRAGGLGAGAPSTGPMVGERVGRDRAAAIARTAVAGDRVKGVEAEREAGRPVWRVTVLAGTTVWDVRVDLATGVVTRTDRRPTADRPAGRPPAPAASPTDDRHGRGTDDPADDHHDD